MPRPLKDPHMGRRGRSKSRKQGGVAIEMRAARSISRGDDVAPCFRDVAEALRRRGHQQHREDDAP
jgi:hypothetical protein